VKPAGELGGDPMPHQMRLWKAMQQQQGRARAAAAYEYRSSVAGGGLSFWMTQGLKLYTGKHIGEYLALTLDGKVLSAPVIQAAIPGGRVEIMTGSAGGFEAAELDRLVRIINGGPLPFALREMTD